MGNGPASSIGENFSSGICLVSCGHLCIPGMVYERGSVFRWRLSPACDRVVMS